MQVKFNVFAGRRDNVDDQAPTNGLAEVAENCDLRKASLRPTKNLVATDKMVHPDSRRLLFNTAQNLLYGTSSVGGGATETFQDSGLFYLFDGSESRAIDPAGYSHRIYPASPSDVASSITTQSPYISVTTSPSVSSLLDAPDRGANLRKRIKEQTHRDVTYIDDEDAWLNSLRSRAAAANPAEGWWPLDGIYRAFHAVYYQAQAQSRTYKVVKGSSGQLQLQPTFTMAGTLEADTLARMLVYGGDVTGMFKAARLVKAVGYAPKIVVDAAATGWLAAIDLPANYTGENGGTLTTASNGAHTWVDIPYSGAPQLLYAAQATIADLWTEGIRAVLANGPDALGPRVINDSPSSALYQRLYGSVGGNTFTIGRPPSDGVFSAAIANLFQNLADVTFKKVTGPTPIRYDEPAVPGLPVSLLPEFIDYVEAYFYERYYIAKTAASTTLTSGDFSMTNDGARALTSICNSFKARQSLVKAEPNPLISFEQGVTSIADGEFAFNRQVPVAYCYTWLDRFGRESTPSLPYVPAITNDGYTQQHTVHITETPPSGAHALALYRAVGDINGAIDNAATEFLRCTVVPSSQTGSISVPPIDQNQNYELESINYFYPRDQRYTCELESGHLIWSAENDKVVQYSYRHVWYATHPSRTAQLPPGWRVMGIVTVGNVAYVITNRKPLVLMHGEDKGPQGLQIDMKVLDHAPAGCSSSASITSTGWGVMYATPTCLLALHGNQARNTTLGLIDSDQWQGLPTIECAVYHDGKYYGFHSTGGFVFDFPDPLQPSDKIPTYTTLSYSARAALSAPDGQLYILPPNTARVYTLGTGVTPYTYRTKRVSLPKPTWFTTLYIRGTGDNVSVKLWMDERLVLDKVIPLNRMVRIPRHARANGVKIELHGEATVNYVTIASDGQGNDYAS